MFQPFLHRRTLLSGAVLAATLGLGGCQAWLERQGADLPPSSGVQPLKGLAQSVSIRRNALGVPLIESHSFHDALFALGYVHASDRLQQMLDLRLLAEGRLAERAGPAALDGDRLMRALNLRADARIVHQNASPRLRQFLEVYARGVNAYLFRQRDRYSAGGYRPAYWKAEDSALLFCLLDFALAGNLQEEIAGLLLADKVGAEQLAWLLPTYPDEPLPVDEADKIKGIALGGQTRALAGLAANLRHLAGLNLQGDLSSQWAVAAPRSHAGRSLLASDSHQSGETPLWHLVQLRAPRYQASGIALPGLPLLLSGFNGSLAWNIGRSMGDSQDLFLERLRRSGGRLEYLADGQWLPLRERQETFFVRGQRPQREAFYASAHGPLLGGTTGPLGIALKRAEFAGDRSLDAFFELSRAPSVEAAHDAVREIRAPAVNLLYADARSIAWQVGGRYPNRRSGRGLLPSPGWERQYGWDGYADSMLHPYDQDPPQGWLVDANQRSVPGGYGVQLSNAWYYPERAERIAERLAADRRHDARSQIALQYDQRTPFAAKLQSMLADPALAQPLARAIAALPAAERTRAELALARLQAFDGQLSAHSADAALYAAFLQESARQTFLDELGGEQDAAWLAFVDLARFNYSAQADHLLGRADSPFWDDRRTPQVEDKPAIIARSLAAAVAQLDSQLGSDRSRWQWGALHRYPQLPGARTPLPAGGDHSTVNLAANSWGTRFDAWSAPALRLVVDFALDEPLQAQVRGQSEHPTSPYHAAAREALLKGRYTPLPLREANLQRAYGNQRLLLTPAR